MAAPSPTPSSLPERDAFIKALVAALCATGDALGIECTYDPSKEAVTAAVPSPAGGDLPCVQFLHTWLALWAVHANDSATDRAAAEEKLKQRAVAGFTEVVTLRFLAATGVTLPGSEPIPTDPVSHIPKNILPKLRITEHYSMMREACREDIPSPLPRMASISLAPLPYHAELCVDTEEQTFMVFENRLSEWGLSISEALEQSLDNLRSHQRRTLEEWKANMMHVRGHLYMSGWSDCYDAPTLLLTPELRAWAAAVGLRGRVVAIPLTVNTLLVTGSEEEEGLAYLALVARDMMAKLPRWLSTRPLVLKPAGTATPAASTNTTSAAGAGHGAGAGATGEAATLSMADIAAEWEPYLPDWGPGQPASATALRVLEKTTITEAYSQQKQRMSHPSRADTWRVLAGYPEGGTCHIASLSLRGNTPETICSLPQGVRTVLPRADVVCLEAVRDAHIKPTSSEDSQSRLSVLGQVSWATFVEAMPEGTLTALRDEDGDEVLPPYFVVSGIPDAAKLFFRLD